MYNSVVLYIAQFYLKVLKTPNTITIELLITMKGAFKINILRIYLLSKKSIRADQ